MLFSVLDTQRWGPVLHQHNYTLHGCRRRTLKNSCVVPSTTLPYLISVCLARSSADSIGDCMRSAVKNAARLAVYDDIRMRVKNHQTLPTIRPDIDLHPPVD